MRESDVSYVAGLFDGEGSVTYKQYMRKRKGQKKAYPTWSIRMEMAMTDKSALVLVQDILKVGTVNEKRYKSKYTKGWKRQWRWQCQYRDAYYVSCLLFPYVHVKLDKIQKIINHYGDSVPHRAVMNGNIVDLEEYKKLMSLE